ncbi:polymeric immunoglobulin receptor-like [Colossoma macropomum]|uniref:polymeric immunoglobulin receptor-like n=1 Tax=Colossoma macropomum TaxID=42526 RepID=UPI0018652900|nr:polymeric immunoglobulin receptor-like [Colossoma macropomum]
MDKTGMTRKILLIFTLFLISVGGGESERVTGYSGGGILIKCRYNTTYTSNTKYFCKSLWPNCTDQIKKGVKNEWIKSGGFSLFKTGDKNEWIHSGRSSLFDNTSAAVFQVMISNLTVEDSGTYQCGVHIDFKNDIYTPVELKVEEDQDCEKSISVSGHVRRSVNISCKYPQSHSSDPKFLCSKVRSAVCKYKTSVKESRRWINEGKLYLHDDGKQIFTVIINSLTEGDSGEYWCGAESDWTSDHGYKVYITQINLRVTGSLQSGKEQPATTSSSTSPSSSTPQSTETASSTSTMNSLFKISTGPDVLSLSSTHISSPTTKPTTSSTSKPSSSPLSATGMYK